MCPLAGGKNLLIKNFEYGLWPQGGARESCSAREILEIINSVADRPLYGQIRDNQKSIDLLSHRLGASLNKDLSTARIFMDYTMINRERKRDPEQDPQNLLNRLRQIIYLNNHRGAKFVNITMDISDIRSIPDGNYYYMDVRCGNWRRANKSLRAVILATVLKHIDDAFTELDLKDGVFGF